jgi:hypothetical protein
MKGSKAVPCHKILPHVKRSLDAMVMQWFHQQSREFFAEQIQELVQQWVACLNAHWKYFIWPLLLNPEQSSNGFHLNSPHKFYFIQFVF